MDFSRQQFTYKEALAKATDLCGRSEKCSYDLEQKCHEWQLSGEETAKLIAYLKQEKFIDHQRYATSFVNDKFRFNKWGKIKAGLRFTAEADWKISASGKQWSIIREDVYRKVLSSSCFQRKRKRLKEKDPYIRRKGN